MAASPRWSLSEALELGMRSMRPQRDAKRTHGVRRRWSRRRAVVIAVLIGLVMALAGCVSTPSRVPLPTKFVATPAPAGIGTTATMNARQQILAALAGYTTALGQAESSRSSALARQLLRPYLAASRIDGLVRAMSAIWARRQMFNGQAIRHVSSLRVLGRRAFVHECDNTSDMDLVDIATGDAVPGSWGMARANIVTCLGLASGHWLVQFQLLEGAPCVP